MNSAKKNRKTDISISKAKAIIRSPVITEKSTKVSQFNQFVFNVDFKSNAKEIKIAIEKLFKVKVTKVNTLITRGKVKTFKGKIGQRIAKKRAIVTLEQGNSIDMSTSI